MTSRSSPNPTKDSPPSRTRRLLSRLSLRRPLSAASLQSLVEEEDQELRGLQQESPLQLQEGHQPSTTAAAAPLSPSSSSVSPFFISSSASAPAIATRRRASTIARASTEPSLEPSNLPELSLPSPLHPAAPSPSSSPTPSSSSSAPSSSKSASSAAITMIKSRHSSELTSRRRSTALSSLRGTREGQPAGKEALAGLLDFLASPSGTSSGSLTPTTVAEPQPTVEPQTLPTVHIPAQIPPVGSAINAAGPKKEKKKKKEKKAKANENKKSEGTPKKEGSRSPGSAAQKGSSPSDAERRLPDQLAMAALLEKEKLEWEKELRTPTHKATGSADVATVRIQKKERRLSFTLRRRSSANLSALVEHAGCTPQDAFFIEGGGSQAEQRVHNTAKAKTLRMSKREARMTWSPEMAAEMISQNNGSPVRFA